MASNGMELEKKSPKYSTWLFMMLKLISETSNSFAMQIIMHIRCALPILWHGMISPANGLIKSLNHVIRYELPFAKLFESKALARQI